MCDLMDTIGRKSNLESIRMTDKRRANVEEMSVITRMTDITQVEGINLSVILVVMNKISRRQLEMSALPPGRS
ncbi:hypothetical protein GCM10026983_26440 [Gracilibacillus alcaliphilus]